MADTNPINNWLKRMACYFIGHQFIEAKNDRPRLIEKKEVCTRCSYWIEHTKIWIPK